MPKTGGIYISKKSIGEYVKCYICSMLKKLREKWGVGPLQVVLILCTFAIGGSLSGYLARNVMNLLPIDNSALYGVLYILVVTILWPMCVILVSVFFGQYAFFKGYLSRMASRIFKKKKKES